MMKIAFITRSTLHAVPGGDTVQIMQTARHLEKLGVTIDLYGADERIDYRQYDLLHCFNITRPADLLYHIKKSKRPVAVSTILIDYFDFDRQFRQGLPGLMLKTLPNGTNEYVKTVARWILRKDKLPGKSFLWKGQKRSIREILNRADWLLPNSEAEYRQIENQYGIKKNYSVVYNGINENVFRYQPGYKKNDRLVVCAARIEGRKNQLNLIRALNNTEFTLLLTGQPAPNQLRYYEECKRIAGRNIIFCGRVPIKTLARYYQQSKVHVLPSWHETCGLSSLEAAAMGCNLVITDKGFTREYFGDHAFYCDPADPVSIYKAVQLASDTESNQIFRNKVLKEFTWERAAATTYNAYQNILSTCRN